MELNYQVAGQGALAVFASLLQGQKVQPIWELAGGFDVETSITLTKDNEQDIIDENWSTAEDPEGERLLRFCDGASRLSDDETCDWPPYLCLSRMLDAKNTPADLERYFGAVCAHATCIIGPSGGWNEIMDRQGAGLPLS